jgi:hypothetical protein
MFSEATELLPTPDRPPMNRTALWPVIPSRQERECSDMTGSDHGEVTTIQRGNLGDAESFGRGHDRSVGGPEREVAVAPHQLCRPSEVRCRQVDQREVSGGEGIQEE